MESPSAPVLDLLLYVALHALAASAGAVLYLKILQRLRQRP